MRSTVPQDKAITKSSPVSLVERTDRFYRDKAPDNRMAFQRDRDRILYTTSFRRLARVTQVVSSDEGHVFHNRLTHSLQVAQVGRRIAEKLLRENKASNFDIDPDVVEAACLAHDPQGSHQKRPTVVTSKPANESGLGLGCFTPSPPEEASLFSCANSVDRI